MASFRSPSYRPPTLPTVAVELMDLVQRTDVNVEIVTAKLEQDPLLAAHVLKLVSSAAYAGRMQITTLKQAVVRLGLSTIRDVVMEASLNVQLFRGDGYSESRESLRRHSLATGHLARLVCSATTVDPEYAFLCGLLHDLGTAGALLALAQLGRGKPPWSLLELWPAIDPMHPELSALIAKLWKLPPEIEDVLRCHHSLDAKGPALGLSCIVMVAEQMATDLGYGFSVPTTTVESDLAVQSAAPGPAFDGTPKATYDAAVAHLKMTPAQLATTRVSAQVKLDAAFGGGATKS